MAGCLVSKWMCGSLAKTKEEGTNIYHGDQHSLWQASAAREFSINLADADRLNTTEHYA